MTNTEHQTALNEILCESIKHFLRAHPSMEPQAMINAIDDTKEDSLVLWREQHFTAPEASA